MISIIGYDKGVVKFVCSECKMDVYEDMQDTITDNCAVELKMKCPNCDDSRALYFLRCTNPALAKDLNATLEAIKIRRREEQNGNQINGEVSDRRIQAECC